MRKAAGSCSAKNKCRSTALGLSSKQSTFGYFIFQSLFFSINLQFFHSRFSSCGAVVYNRPRIPAVPLVILTSSSEPADWSPQLARYVEEGFVSEYRVITVSADIFHGPNITALDQALEFLVEKAPQSPTQYLGKTPYI